MMGWLYTGAIGHIGRIALLGVAMALASVR